MTDHEPRGGEPRGAERADAPPPPAHRPARWRRRAVLGGIVGVGAAATAVAATRDLPSLNDEPAPGGASGTVRRPSDTSAYATRDESYADALGEADRIAAAGPGGGKRVFPTAGEAAASATPTAPTILDTSDPVLHLLRRTTFGPTPALVDEVHAQGIDAWLASQLAPAAIPDTEADAVVARLPEAMLSQQELRARHPGGSRLPAEEYAQATMARQIWSRRQLLEVMTDFWDNHFNVTTPGAHIWDLAPSYHDGVIRTHALGSFTDMLLAVMRHPAMLNYLTNVGSTKDAVNENLGRELLELHTVGVASGYDEDDVLNSAHILTGRTVVPARGPGPGPPGTFFYDPALHWTGPVSVLDFSHLNATPEGGLEVGDAYLRHLAAHPATGQAIARKLAVRFVSDMPAPELVDRLAAAYSDNGTAIIPVLDTLFRSAEFWESAGQKVRRPHEDAVATARVIGTRLPPEGDPRLQPLLWWSMRMGQQPLAWPSPNGYPDVHAAWRSATGRLMAWNYHTVMVQNDDPPSTPPAELVAGRPQATVGEYVDSLCQVLCGQTFQPAHRDALLAFVGADAATPTAGSPLPDVVHHLVPVILHAPYFLLR